MIWPDKFDLNEWFILAFLAVMISICCWLPKRFPHTITILIALFCMFVPKLFDTAIGTEPYDMYDINDSHKYEFFDLLTWMMYPPVGYLFLYALDRWRLRGYLLFAYIVLCSLFGVGFEWLTMKIGIFEFHGWQSSASLPVYLLVQSGFVAFFAWIKRLHE